MVDAFNEILDEARLRRNLPGLRVDEAKIAAHLYTRHLPDPDLLIRTSGEMRVSNFLLWQIAYAEMYVTDVLWPDFRRHDLLLAIADYQKRDRRFGGLSGAPSTTSQQRLAAAGAPTDEADRHGGCARPCDHLCCLAGTRLAAVAGHHGGGCALLPRVLLHCHRLWTGPAWPPGLRGGSAGAASPRGDVLMVTLICLLALTLMLRSRDLAKALPAAGALLFGVIYVYGPWRSAIGLHAANPQWLFVVLALNWLGDSAAYYVGRAWGRTRWRRG